jgi:hypothetical protein
MAGAPARATAWGPGDPDNEALNLTARYARRRLAPARYVSRGSIAGFSPRPAWSADSAGHRGVFCGVGGGTTPPEGD